MENTARLPLFLQYQQKVAAQSTLPALQQFKYLKKFATSYFCNILNFPKKFATIHFATCKKFSKNLATFFCNKNVAKNSTLQHFSNVAKKRPMLQKKNLWWGGDTFTF